MSFRRVWALPYVVLLFPLDVVVAIFLLLASAVAAVFDRRYPTKTGGHRPPLRRSPATIQILNWDGKHLLAECLPSVLEAVRADAGNHRVLVVDNGSTDGSVSLLKEHFPQVRVLELDRNYGFGGGNNRGVEAVDTDVVIFLNNDMIVDRGFLTPLLDGFTDDTVFAVTSQIFLEDSTKRRVETGKTRGDFKKGFFNLWHSDIDADDDRKMTLPVFWAGGGACAIDIRKYREIGGFDDLYHPAYVEDTDISYQAWKRGWKCLLAPASRVVHKHRATSSRLYTHRFVDNTIRRNLYLFIWKNVTDRQMLLDHILSLPGTHGRAAMNGDGWFEVHAYVRAFLLLPRSVDRRLRNVGRYLLSDREVLIRSQQ